jgi:hypothetical protein
MVNFWRFFQTIVIHSWGNFEKVRNTPLEGLTRFDMCDIF